MFPPPGRRTCPPRVQQRPQAPAGGPADRPAADAATTGGRARCGREAASQLRPNIASRRPMLTVPLPRTSSRRHPRSSPRGGRRTATALRRAWHYRKKVRDVPPLAFAAVKVEAERLRQDFSDPEVVQRQQKLLLFQRLEPVKPTRRHHELQTWPVPLASSPRKPPDHPGRQHRHRGHVTNRPGHLALPDPPRHCPPTRPPVVRNQP